MTLLIQFLRQIFLRRIASQLFLQILSTKKPLEISAVRRKRQSKLLYPLLRSCLHRMLRHLRLSLRMLVRRPRAGKLIR